MKSLTEIKEKAQRNKRDKPFLLMFGYSIHRDISMHLTRTLLYLFPNIKPQYVGFSMIFVGILGSVLLFAFEVLAMGVVGFILIYLSFLLDKVDGEISRFKEVFNVRGVFLDELYHILITPLLLVSVYYQYVKEIEWLLYTLLIAVYLVVANRYNRKIPHLLYVKLQKRVREHSLEDYQGSKVIKKIFNFVLFRLSSILERFDIILIVLFAAYLGEFYLEGSYLTYYLIGFTVLASIQFVRRSVLNYFGGADYEVHRIETEGY